MVGSSEDEIKRIANVCAGCVQMPGSEGHEILREDLYQHLSKAFIRERNEAFEVAAMIADGTSVSEYAAKAIRAMIGPE